MQYSLKYLNNSRKRLLSKVVKNKNTNCWEYQGATTKDGYGFFSLKHKMFLAHRISYLLFVGIIPNNLFVCHTCDNRRCINPEHLWLGTQSENINDMLSKGRKIFKKGSEVWKAKLTESKVKEIRDLYKSGNYTYKQLSFIYCVTKEHIGAIIRKESWNY